MIEVDHIQSGFDLEILLGEKYLSYLLLSAVDSGDFNPDIAFSFPVGGQQTPVNIRLKWPETINRNYALNPLATLPDTTDSGSFDIRLLNDMDADLELTLIADITAGGPLPFSTTDVALVVGASFDIVESRNEAGELDDVLIDFSIISLQSTDPLLGPLIDSNEASIITTLNATLSRLVSGNLLGSSDGIAEVRTRKFTSGGNRCFGVFVNLTIRTGPEPTDTLPGHGNVDDGMNFLPPGSDFAMGVSPLLFDRLESHLRFEFAERRNENSDDLVVRDGDTEIGQLKDIRLRIARSRYQLADLSMSERTTCLRLRVLISSVILDADVNVTIELFPILEDGLLSWVVEQDIDIDILFEALPLFTVAALTLATGLPGLILGALFVGALAIAQEQVIEPLIDARLGNVALGDAGNLAEVLNLIPQRVELSRYRWDPFYETSHQLLVPFDTFLLDEGGIACHGDVQLANQPLPYSATILRDARRGTTGSIRDYQYKIKDHADHQAFYSIQAPASDRMTIRHDDTDHETDLFLLSPGELDARLEQGKVLSRILLRAHMVDIRHNQVFRIATMTKEELNDGEAAIRARYAEEETAQLIAEGGDALRAEAESTLDDDATEEEIQERMALLVLGDRLTRVAERVANDLADDLVDYMHEHFRLALSPHEYGLLQTNRYAIGMQYFDLINRQGRYYYRDRADGRTSDNLVALPGFRAQS